jgi:HAD superfamily hydrolase (TIGR01490 family)
MFSTGEPLSTVHAGGAMSRPLSTKAIAFFDLDGTLVKATTQALLLRFLLSAKIVTKRFAAGAVAWFVGYKLGLVKVTEKERARSASMLAGMSVKEVDRAISQFVDTSLMPRLNTRAVEALREHQQAGDEVIVVSAALEPVVKWLAARLGADVFAGAPCEIIDSHYSGRLSGLSPHGEHKAQVARDLASSRGVDPADCWAYADHESDEAILRVVGHPVAVNARPRLAKIARAEGWSIIP